MRKSLTILIAAGAIGTAVAGCGTQRAAGIATVPSGGPTATTPAVTTPKTGALSKEPTIAKPSGAAPTKLVEKNLVTGTGATAQSGDTVTVNYVGALYSNGKVFDASWKRDQTFTTTLSSTAGIIKGWVQGIPGMKVGGRRQLIIPASLGYGTKGSGTTIPPNATLIFDIDLLKVSKSAS